MIHKRKTWISANDLKAIENENNWKICKEREYTFKKNDYFSSNIILNDYLMFRVFINFMIENERIKKYFINFKIKDYLNKDHVDVKEATKRRNLKTRTWHYIIICQTYQLHDEKNERKNLRRVIFETSTIKINEVLDDICVIQSKSRVKNNREIRNINFIKIAKKLIHFITSIVKIAKEFILFSTSIKESIHEKRRNSENDQSRHQKRFKRDESKNEKKIINLEFEESDVKFRKKRV